MSGGPLIHERTGRVAGVLSFGLPNAGKVKDVVYAMPIADVAAGLAPTAPQGGVRCFSGAPWGQSPHPAGRRRGGGPTLASRRQTPLYTRRIPSLRQTRPWSLRLARIR